MQAHKLFITFFILLGCSSTSESVLSLSRSGKCLQALRAVGRSHQPMSFFYQGRRVEGYLLNFNLEQGKLNIENILTLNDGKIRVIRGCPASFDMNYGNRDANCIGTSLSTTEFVNSRQNLGKTVYAGDISYRCGDLSWLYEEMKEVALCYGDEGRPRLGISLILDMKYQKDIMKCLNMADRKDIKQVLDYLSRKAR